MRANAHSYATFRQQVIETYHINRKIEVEFGQQIRKCLPLKEQFIDTVVPCKGQKTLNTVRHGMSPQIRLLQDR